MIFEYLFITLLVLSGYSVLISSRLSPLERTIFALPLGLCLYLLVVYSQIILNVSTTYYVTLALLLIACVLLLAINIRRISAQDVKMLSILFIAFTAVFIVSNSVSLVKFHFDSFRYMTIGNLLASDNLGEASAHFRRTRLSPIAMLNAPSYFSGEYYFRSLMPFTALNLVTILYYTIYRAFFSIYDSTKIHLLAIAASVLLISINRTVWNAFYINNHLLEALYVLIVAGAAWLRAIGRISNDAATFLLGFGVFGIVLCRPEGFVMAGLALLPVLLTNILPKRNRVALGLIWGGAIIVQAAPSVLVSFGAGSPLEPETVKLLALAVAICVVSPVWYLDLFDRHAHGLLLAGNVALWLILAAFVFADWRLFEASLHAATVNLLYGQGGWGVSLIVLAALAGASLFIPSVQARLFLWFPVAGFVPTVLILAFLRDHAYRVGVTDSLNRMVFHIVPLAIVLIASAAMDLRTSREDARQSGR